MFVDDHEIRLSKRVATHLLQSLSSDSLINKLQQPVYIKNKIANKIANNSMVVYDFNTLEIKAIIEDMKKKSEQDNIVFR